jgi:hypothetical protein
LFDAMVHPFLYVIFFMWKQNFNWLCFLKRENSHAGQRIHACLDHIFNHTHFHEIKNKTIVSRIMEALHSMLKCLDPLLLVHYNHFFGVTICWTDYPFSLDDRLNLSMRCKQFIPWMLSSRRHCGFLASIPMSLFRTMKERT